MIPRTPDLASTVPPDYGMYEVAWVRTLVSLRPLWCVECAARGPGTGPAQNKYCNTTQTE